MIKWNRRIKAKHFKKYYSHLGKEVGSIVLKYKDVEEKWVSKGLEILNKAKESPDVLNQLREDLGPSIYDIANAEEKYILDIYSALAELNESLDNLLDIPIYLKSLTTNFKKKVSYYKIVRYHKENYLHRIYVFQERLNRYFNLIKKRYKKTKESKMIEIIDKLFELIKEMLAGVVKERGGHVHVRDFYDIPLLNLYSSCIIEEIGLKEFKESRKEYKLQVELTKRIWIWQMNEYNKALITVLDNIFEAFIKYEIY